MERGTVGGAGYRRTISRRVPGRGNWVTGM